MLAFVLLSLVSPVTYSVASLIKRVFVIVIAIVWFGNSTTSIQAVGIALTFFGLYLYDRTSDSAKADRRAKLEGLRAERPLLPFTAKDTIQESPLETTLNAPFANDFGNVFSSANGHVVRGDKKADVAGPGRPRTRSHHNETPWLPPGTKQEETWKPIDLGNSLTNGIKS